ncbi:MAG: BA14K family protein [Thiohalocapsa sp.]
MSDAPAEQKTGIQKKRGRQSGTVEAKSRAVGNRSLEAGGEFLKALATDLAAVASRIRLPRIARHRPTPPQASLPSHTPSGPAFGHVLWRLSIMLFGLATIFAGVLSAVTLWVLFGLAPEPQKSKADTLGRTFEARMGEPPGRAGPLTAGDVSRQDLGHQAAAQDRPGGVAAIPSTASSGSPSVTFPAGRSGSSSPGAAEPKKTAKGSQIEPGAGADQPQLARTETQNRHPAARQPEMSKTVTESRPQMQCDVARCAGTYKSFHAADCTYQPYGGGPRNVCELSTRSAAALPQASPAALGPGYEAKDTRVAERAPEVPKSATTVRAGAQCNVDRCAATYASFHAADCTYQPYGGGPRRLRAIGRASPSPQGPKI